MKEKGIFSRFIIAYAWLVLVQHAILTAKAQVL